MASTPPNIFSCFKDRVVLITGAGGALGTDASTMFAQYGACLVLIDNHAGRLEAIVSKLKEEVPEEKVLGRVGDAGSLEDINQLVEGAISKFGKIDHLINVVGVKNMGDITTASLESIDDSFTDIRVTFNVTKACLPHLLKSKGSVVNISSVASLKIKCIVVDSRGTLTSRCMNAALYPHAVGYSVSKAGLNHMSKIFAIDLASKGVRVNNILLVTVRCNYNMTTGVLKTQEEQEEYFKTCGAVLPTGRVPELEEVTSSVLFLSSDAASFITGVNLPIDMGYTLTASRVL